MVGETEPPRERGEQTMQYGTTTTTASNEDYGTLTQLLRAVLSQNGMHATPFSAAAAVGGDTQQQRNVQHPYSSSPTAALRPAFPAQWETYSRLPHLSSPVLGSATVKLHLGSFFLFLIRTLTSESTTEMSAVAVDVRRIICIFIIKNRTQGTHKR